MSVLLLFPICEWPVFRYEQTPYVPLCFLKQTEYFCLEFRLCKEKMSCTSALVFFLFNIFPSFFYAYVFNLNNHIKQLWAFFLPILYGMSIYAVYNILDSFSFSISCLKTCRNLFPLQTIVH